jgi:hydrogenase-4 component B
MNDLFRLTAGLLVTGAVIGYAAPAAGRLLHVPGGRARAWGMVTSMMLAVAASAVVGAAGAWHLVRCTRAASGAAACERTATVLDLPAPIDQGPYLGLVLRVDALTTLFLVLVAVFSAAIAVYSLGWLRGDPQASWVAGSFDLFVAATLLAVAADIGLWVIIALELVTLFSTDLVRYRGRCGGSLTESTTAVSTYLTVSHVGLICLLVGLIPVLPRAMGGLPVAPAAPTGLAQSVSIGLILTGLAARAGLVPFHFWVPVVHPQMPTNTHAMMSAVMLKIPVYLMIRLLLGHRLGSVPPWWGAVLLLVSATTALVTVAYAMVSKDLKTALAYHSVENVAIIVAGLGAAVLFGAAGGAVHPRHAGAATVALIACLFHVVNHAAFKSLLFLGTGSIERITGTVRLEALGGLLRLAPWTGVPFLIGALAISGLPPLNAFVSEWLTLQAFFGGGTVYTDRPSAALPALVALVTAVLALAMAVALTATALLKLAGDCLLGPPRAAVRSTGQSWPERAVLTVLALACVALGLQPWVLLPWLTAAAMPLVNGAQAGVLDADPWGLRVDLVGYTASVPTLPLLLLWLLPLLIGAVTGALRWPGRQVWVGGTAHRPEEMQYTGSAFSAQIWDPIATVGQDAPSGPLPATVRVTSRRVVVEQGNRAVNVLLSWIEAGSERFGTWVHSGDVRRYLLYIGIAVAAGLLIAILYPVSSP